MRPMVKEKNQRYISSLHANSLPSKTKKHTHVDQWKIFY